MQSEGRSSDPTHSAGSSPPAGSRPHVRAEVLRVLSYNVHGLYLASRDRAPRMRAIGALLRELSPDLVALQEAFVASDRRILVDELAGTELAHSAYFPSGLVGSGLFVLSKAPIRTTRFMPFTHNGSRWKPWEGDWYAGKGVALARIEGQAGPIDLFDTHAIAGYGGGLDGNEGARCTQMVELVDFVRASALPGVPAIVAGDLNTRLEERPYRIACAVGGLERLAQGETGLDHVLAAPTQGCEIMALGTRVLRERVRIGARSVELSDHPALFTTLRVRRSTERAPERRRRSSGARQLLLAGAD